jgi:hypothetical protein
MSIGLNANNDGTGSVQIGGSDAIQLSTGLAATFVGNLTLNGNPSGIVKAATAVASTSGTSIDFTGIPSTVKRITVMFQGISVSGTSDFAIQLGTGATPTYTTSGYSGSTANTSSGFQNPTTQVLCVYTASAASVSSGIITIALLNSSTNLWSISGTGCSAASFASFTGYSVTLSAVLTAVRIKTGNGTDTFDAGSINILYE